jgi:hypothetical protein
MMGRGRLYIILPSYVGEKDKFKMSELGSLMGIGCSLPPVELYGRRTALQS